MPPARRRTDAKASTAAMIRPGIMVIHTAANPTRAVRRPKAPAKALYDVVAGAVPFSCHLMALIDIPSTHAAKRVWKARVMIVASISAFSRGVPVAVAFV